MDWIHSHSRVDDGITVGSARITWLLFADDLVLLVASEQGLQHGLDRFSTACNQTGMQISTKKTEVLCLSRHPSECLLQVNVNKQQVEKFNILVWH